MLNFEAATSKFCYHFLKFGCQPWKSKTDLCMTNGSKVLIYLSFFIVPQRLALVSNVKKISKSNKSELWKCLSYRGLPNFFEVGSQTFLNDYKICPRQWGVHGHLARFQPKKEHSFDTKCQMLTRSL